MNKENILEIDNLERSYSTVMPDGETKVYSVLRGISFQVKRGEFIGIMGSSGCGKTTLLKTIGMLNKPNGGKVLYNGEDTTEIYGDHLAENQIQGGNRLHLLQSTVQSTWQTSVLHMRLCNQRSRRH